jgi:hypothetical protein
VNGKLFAYSEQRALEDAAFTWEVTPTRMFALLFPVWLVTISADVVEEEDYELIDRYLSRGIAEGAWSTTAELADAFALEPELVDRALRALVAIGHLRSSQGRWELTELGLRSVRDQRRYVFVREDRRKLYFDGFGSRPLPRACYAPTVTLLPDGVVPHGFRTMVSLRGFDPGALDMLAANPQRNRFNLPERIDRPRQLGASEQVFLPLYVVRGQHADGTTCHLAYCQAAGEADPDLSDLVSGTADLLGPLEDEDPPGDGEAVRAREWLRRRNLDGHQPVRLRSGLLRVSLPRAAFGGKGIPLHQVGSFVMSGTGFFQLWCAEEDLRWQALLGRIDSLLASRSRVDSDRIRAHVSRIARQLDLGVVGVPDVRQMAARAGRNGLAAQLAKIT